MLATSQALTFGSAIVFYFNPNVFAVITGILGVLTRYMSPIQKPQYVIKFGLRFLVILWVSTCLTWLKEIGLRELISKAVEERFEPTPILLYLSLLAFLAFRDWQYLLKLNSNEIEAYYNERVEA